MFISPGICKILIILRQKKRKKKSEEKSQSEAKGTIKLREREP